jgi:hypothetical protein
VEGSPALLARVAELRELQAAVRDVSPADRAVRDRAIRAALDAYDSEADAGATDPGTVRPLPVRRGPTPRTWRLVGAAAAALLLAALVPLLARDTGQDDTAADQTTFEETSEAIGGADQSVADAPPSSSPSPSVGLTLGAYDSVDDLLDAAGPVVRDSPASATADEEGYDAAATDWDRCPVPLVATRVVRSQQPATVRGDPVVLVVETAPDGDVVATVVRLADCQELARRSLGP